MTKAWLDFLHAQGGRLQGPTVFDFGAPADELLAARDGLVLADLSHYGLIALSGEESQDFLHSQVTNDLRPLRPESAVFAGYCTAKGRLLANFLVFRRGDDILLMLPDSVREATQKRLSMFILRAKTKARDAGAEWLRLGLAGPGAGDLLGHALGTPAPAAIMAVVHTDAAFAVRLGDARFDILVKPEAGPVLWARLAQGARPVGTPAWDWLMVQAGIPAIVAETQDQFVPQMANMDILHGLSFHKGCYPGQEIVARSQYLGKQKRRMYLAHVDAQAGPGDAVYSPELAGQPAGMVANAAPAPGGGSDLLAVMLMDSREADQVTLGAPDGPRLVFQALPYDA